MTLRLKQFSEVQRANSIGRSIEIIFCAVLEIHHGFAGPDPSKRSSNGP
jgi:hypothetical protein